MTSVRSLIEESRLPKIPGQTFGAEMMRRRFHKPQLLKPGDVADGGPSVDPMPYLSGTSSAVRNGVPSHADSGAAASGGAVPPTLSAAEAAAAREAAAPLDNVLLRFDGFFREAVHESPLETERARRVLLSFHTSDSTLAVTESRNDETGLSRGLLVRRHRVLLPTGEPIAPEHLLPGSVVPVYGKSIEVTGCDEATRDFLCALGWNVPPNGTSPEDAVAVAREAASRHVRAAGDRDLSRQMELSAVGRSTRLTPSDVAASRRFFRHDRQVLRFYAAWDDTDALFGDFHVFVLQYFLADGTIQISEVSPPNGGKDPFPSFVKRQQVPTRPAMAAPGFDRRKASFYTADDLFVGARLNVFGRNFLIYDCDAATRAYVEAARGEPQNALPLNRKGAPRSAVVAAAPSAIGAGGAEDEAVQSWMGLAARPPKRDVGTFLRHTGTKHAALKFQLRFANPTSVDAPRRFVLTYFQADASVQVFERQERNSGFSGGQFLTRARVAKPATSAGAARIDYTPSDFFIGANVDLHGHQFVVCGADERTIAYMEGNPLEFPNADIDAVVGKLRGMLASRDSGAVLREAFEAQAASPDGIDGTMDFRDFAATLRQAQLPLTEHEVLTVVRHFDRAGDGQVTWRAFLDALTTGTGAAEAAAVMAEGATWEDNLAAQRGGEDSSVAAAAATARHTVDYVAAVGQRGADRILGSYGRRPQLWREVFRKHSDHSTDGRIGEQEFRLAVEELRADVSENEFRALAIHLFPGERKRIPLIEMGPIGSAFGPCPSFNFDRSQNTPCVSHPYLVFPSAPLAFGRVWPALSSHSSADVRRHILRRQPLRHPAPPHEVHPPARHWPSPWRCPIASPARQTRLYIANFSLS